MRSLLMFVVAVIVASGACGQNSAAPVVNDLSVPIVPDLAVQFDLTPPSECDPVDKMSDGQPCGMTGCPAGTIGVGAGAACLCWQKCDPSAPTDCACDRRCATLTSGDAGVVGGACLLANGPGERCGQAGGTGLNAQGCAQTLVCVNADDPGMFRYCAYDCTADGMCPAQSSCLQLNGVAEKACALDSVATGLAIGAACAAGDVCVTGSLCDTTGGGTCKPQCDRAGATCASGTCTALTDGTRTVGYVCK